MYLVGNLESWKKELAADHQRPSDKPDRPWKKGLLPEVFEGLALTVFEGSGFRVQGCRA